MIRALLKDRNGKQTVLTIIDGENITRLLADEPLLFNLRRLDPSGQGEENLSMPDVDVVVAYSKNPLATFRDMQERLSRY